MKRKTFIIVSLVFIIAFVIFFIQKPWLLEKNIPFQEYESSLKNTEWKAQDESWLFFEDSRFVKKNTDQDIIVDKDYLLRETQYKGKQNNFIRIGKMNNEGYIDDQHVLKILHFGKRYLLVKRSTVHDEGQVTLLRKNNDLNTSAVFSGNNLEEFKGQEYVLEINQNITDFISKFKGQAKILSRPEFESFINEKDDLDNFNDQTNAFMSELCDVDNWQESRSCLHNLDEEYLKEANYQNIERNGSCLIVSFGQGKKYCDFYPSSLDQSYSFYRIIAENKDFAVLLHEFDGGVHYIKISISGEKISLPVYSSFSQDGKYLVTFDSEKKDMLVHEVYSDSLGQFITLPVEMFAQRLFWVSKNAFVIEIKYDDTDILKSAKNTNSSYYIYIDLIS